MIPNWLRSMFAGSSKSPLRKAGRLTKKTRPQFLVLEDRCVPANITVNSLLDNTTPADGFVTLREAFNAINTNTATDLADVGTGNDTIIFAGLSGTANLSIIGDISHGNTGLAVGAGVTIAVDGSTSTTGITINAISAMRIFYVPATGSLSLNSVTVTGGTAPGNVGGTGEGGGGGSAGAGGAIWNDGTLTVDASTFTNNNATGGDGGVGTGGGSGGGTGTGGGGGGGLLTAGSNSAATIGGTGGAPAGGAGGTAGANAVAGGVGGGGGGGSGTGAAARRNGAAGGEFGGGGGGGDVGATAGAAGFAGGAGGLSGNGGNGGNGLGGAIFNNTGGILTVNNSTFTLNSATPGVGGTGTVAGASGLARGGAIYIRAGSGAVTFTHNTLIGNSANGTGSTGGALHAASPITVNNDIFAGSLRNGVAGVTDADTSAALTVSKILNQTPGGGFVPLLPAAQISGVAPLTAVLGSYGGLTQTFALLPGSPAINSGSNAFSLATDQRAVVRPQLATVDLGAFESRGFTSTVAASSTPQRTLINTAFTNTLQTTISSAFGEPITGGVVSFTATPSGTGATATLSAATVNVPASGIVSVTATANGTGTAAGTPYVVTAAATGAANGVFSLVNRVPTLSFATGQPTNTVSGQNINGAGGVNVTLLDQDAVPFTATAVTVTLSSNAFSAGTTVINTDATGLANFTGLQIIVCADNYTISGSALSGVATGVSTAFNVTASQLAFVSVPTTVRSDRNFTVVARGLDAAGNPAVNFNELVTISIQSGPAGGTLSAVTTANASPGAGLGIATLNGVRLDMTGSYTLQARSATLLTEVTAPNATQVNANKIVFTAPGSSTFGAGTVRSESTPNAPGHVDATDFIITTLSGQDILGNPAPVDASVTLFLTGASQVAFNDIIGTTNFGGTTASGAIAGTTFSYTATQALTLDQWGVYILNGNTVSAVNPDANVDYSFPVVNALVGVLTVQARSLVFATQPPAKARTGEAFGTAMVVEAVDVTGSRDLNYDRVAPANIDLALNTVALTDVTVAPAAALAGGAASIAAVDGRVTYAAGLNINRGGQFTITASGPAADNLIPVTSTQIKENASNITFTSIGSTTLGAGKVRSESTPTTAGHNPNFDFVLVTLEGRDANGLKADIDGSVTLSLNTATQLVANDILGTASFGGTKTIAVPSTGNGDAITASFTTAQALTLDQWGNYTVKAATTPGYGTITPTNVSNTLNVEARKLVYSSTPSTPIRSGSGFLAPVQVQALDVLNSIDRNFTQTITLTLPVAVLTDTTPGFAAPAFINGAAGVAAVNGVATYAAGLSINRGGLFTVQANAADGVVQTVNVANRKVNAQTIVYVPVAPGGAASPASTKVPGLGGAQGKVRSANQTALNQGGGSTSFDVLQVVIEGRDAAGAKADIASNLTLSVGSAIQNINGVDTDKTAAAQAGFQHGGGGNFSLNPAGTTANFAASNLTLSLWGDYKLKAQTTDPTLPSILSPTFQVYARQLFFSPVPSLLAVGSFTVTALAKDVTGDVAQNYTNQQTLLNILDLTRVQPPNFNDVIPGGGTTIRSNVTGVVPYQFEATAFRGVTTFNLIATRPILASFIAADKNPSNPATVSNDPLLIPTDGSSAIELLEPGRRRPRGTVFDTIPGITITGGKRTLQLRPR